MGDSIMFSARELAPIIEHLEAAQRYAKLYSDGVRSLDFSRKRGEPVTFYTEDLAKKEARYALLLAKKLLEKYPNDHEKP